MLLAAVGGPKWDTTDPDKPRPEQGLLGLRHGLGLFANLRPVRPLPALYDASPLKREIIDAPTCWSCASSPAASTSARRAAPTAARTTSAPTPRPRSSGSRAPRSRPHARRVTSVDKANVLETSRLWREVVMRVHSAEFPNVELEHLLVDNAAMQLVAAPRHFDVILTENMFGDILSDEAAMLTGSIGLLPSASLGADGPGVFEPVHGSAPDIAGQGIANPLAMILSAALMLRHGLAREDDAARIESAVDRALEAGLRTGDLGGTATTAEATARGPGGADVNASGPHLDERRVRRLGGRQGSRTDARAALRHRRLRGRPRLRDRSAAPRCSATRTTSTGCSSRPRCTTWTSRTRRSRSARRRSS